MVKCYPSLLLSLLTLAIILASVGDVSAGLGFAKMRRDPTPLAVSQVCGQTRHRSLCIESLMSHPAATSAGTKDLVHISVNVTLKRFGKALYESAELNEMPMGALERSAYEACVELLDDSVDLLSRSLSSVSPSLNGKAQASQDVLTWLSAALTNQDTCTDGLSEATGNVKDQMQQQLRDLEELASNTLAIFSSAVGDSDFSGIPIQNRRRRLLSLPHRKSNFPTWLSRQDRVLLDASVAEVLPHADIVVSQDGRGTYKTITEAIKNVPEFSTRRIIIYVKAGKYVEENLNVGRKKINVMFMGDGKGKTVISGGLSKSDDVTTFRTASFAASGMGFIARDMTFENTAGPSKHQAVALRVGADHGVVYRCSIIGYQDTLYVYSNRQFYRECDIYGTVDFICGNAAVVLQNCNIFARKPMDFQKNTVTAQNRKYPQQNTGISIHSCKILATADLEASKSRFPTYLGRPWKLYSRTVVMLSYLGDHINPQGWLEWNARFALDTLYYGEYMNQGPGAALGQRVTWPGYHIINSSTEASKFTVDEFIFGSEWLPSTGVTFTKGLSK